MTASKDDVIRAALMRSQAERADPLGALIERLDALVEPGVKEAWRTEIAGRAKELDAGTVKSIPWDLVKQRLALHVAEASVRLHPLAADEAEAAYAWYLARNATVSEWFLQELDAAIQSIAEAPERWPTMHGRYRRYILHRFVFSVVYSRRGDLLEILAVVDHPQKPGHCHSR